jgi:hypothetical protein
MDFLDIVVAWEWSDRPSGREKLRVDLVGRSDLSGTIGIAISRSPKDTIDRSSQCERWHAFESP